MLQRYELWVYGLKMLGLIFIMVLIVPVAMWVFMIIGLHVLLPLLSINASILENHYRDLLCLSVIIFGPYYVGKSWPSFVKTAADLKAQHTIKKEERADKISQKF